MQTIKDSQLSLRLPLDMKERMESYAHLTGRNKSHVVMESVGVYLAWRMPQIEDLQAAIREADAGKFATESEVEAVFVRYAEPLPVSGTASTTPAKVEAALRRRR